MSDAHDDDLDLDLDLDLQRLRAAGGPRKLPSELRDELVDTCLTAPRLVDAPRVVPDELRARLVASVSAGVMPSRTRRALIRRLQTSPKPTFLAAAAVIVAVLLIAGGIAGARIGRQPTKVAAGPSPTTTTTTEVPTTAAPAAAPTTTGPPTPTTRAPSKPRAQKAPATPSSLLALSTCDQLLAYYRDQALAKVGPRGVDGGQAGVPPGTSGPVRTSSTSGDSAGVAATSFSSTNVQEAGIDEPDDVKTDGQRLFVVDLQRQELRSVRVGGGQAVALGTLPLAVGTGNAKLLLVGDTLVRLTLWQGGWQAGGDRPASEPSFRGTAGNGGTTLVEIIDVRDPAAMKVTQSVEFEGRYVEARLVDGLVRLVIHTMPKGPAMVAPADDSAAAKQRATEENKARLVASTLDDWVPRYIYRDFRGANTTVAAGRVCPCDNTFRPQVFGGFGNTSVVTVDPLDPARRESATVQGGADTVYASVSNVFVGTNAFGLQPDTFIHRFSIAGRRAPTYDASGAVPGHLRNSYSMSEIEGFLRVASTRENGPTSESFISVMRTDLDRLLVVGQVGGLGAGERISATRFIGQLAYVVTYRQADPLYVVDLSNPVLPRVVGELKMLGYSAYLHPLDEGHLLGIGQDATEQARPAGAQASVFDVRDPGKPNRTFQRSLGSDSSSGVEFDAHAFLYWAPTQSAVVPVRDSSFQGAVVLKASADRLDEQGRVTHQGRTSSSVAAITRSLVIGSSLYTVSPAGVLASNLTTLADEAWLAFG